MTEEIFVWGGLAGLLLSYLDDSGLDLPELRRSLAGHDPAQRMPITTWWALLERIAQAQSIPAVGLHIGQHIQVHHLGVLGYLAASCETLGQAMMRFQRFQPLLHNLAPSFVSRQAQGLSLGWDPAYGQSTRISNEVLVAALLRLSRTLTGNQALAPVKVEFPGAAPDDPGCHEQLLGCPVRFRARTLVVQLPLAILESPINGGDPHLRALLDQQAEALLQATPQPDAFLSELQQLMLKALQDGEPSLQQLAQRVGVAERTLYRRLQARGLNYKELLGRLRFQLAQRYLADRQLSLAEIALMLGYSEQSAFTRAFRSWCGQTPLRYRKALVDPPALY